MCSDHFHPWTTAQGQSGHSGVCAAAQSALTLGMVTARCRQHPALWYRQRRRWAVGAGRIWLALGTGEALNERITGQPWPAKRERQKALRDAAEVMRRLWAASRSTTTVASGARHGLVAGASLPLLGRRHRGNRTLDGGWADGLITISQPLAQLRRVVAAFEDGGGRGKPMYLQAKLSYARRTGGAGRCDGSGAPTCCRRNWPKGWTSPNSSKHRPDRSAPRCCASMHVSADLGQHRAWLQELQDWASIASTCTT